MLGVNAVGHVRGVAAADYREGLVTAQRPLSLDPLVGAADPAVRDVGDLLYRRLLALADTALPAADLATGYTISSDGLTYHLPLRSGQQWSDGHPITAADVIATVALVQSVRLGDPAVAGSWQDVHARAELAGVAFDLAGPRASFAAELTRLPILPVGGLSPAQLAQLPRSAAQPMATSGPFAVGRTTATQVVLVPNRHSPRPPLLRQMEFDLFSSFPAASAAFARGDIDALLATDPGQRAALVAAGGTAHDVTSFRFVDLLFNERRPQLADPVVRQAIAATLDRAALVRDALHGMGVVQTSAVPNGYTWAQGPTPGAAAASTAAAVLPALSADGWLRGADGVLAKGTTALRVDLAVADVPPLPALASEIGRQLQALGIRVTVAPLPAPSIRGVLTGSPPAFDLALADWDTGTDPDVSSFWRSTAMPPAGFNVSGGVGDPFLDQALDRLATLTDPVARRDAAASVSSLLSDDLPAVFIETPKVSLVVRAGLSVRVAPVGDSGARYEQAPTWHRG